MARKYSSSQLRSKLQQTQRKQQQAINDFNRAVRKYNQEVRAHNARVRANRQRLRSELARFNRHSTTTTISVEYRTTVTALQESYVRLENRAENASLSSKYDWLLDLSERETANSLEVTNLLLGADVDSQQHEDNLEHAELLDNLQKISPELDARWRGAVFALDPRNPDAARHFCTSAREIMTQILEIKAPDSEVIRYFPHCDRTDQGKPTRRAKIKFILQRNNLFEGTLEEFVDHDMENILQLFHLFNRGTHGSSGAYDIKQLTAIKKRVEDGIMFLSEIIDNA